MGMHWEIDPSGRQAIYRELPDFPVGLLYGYGVYTTFQLPLADEWLQKHLNRLESNAMAIGLQWPYANSALIPSILQRYRPDRPICRLTVFPDVAGYGDFYRAEPLASRLVLSVRDCGARLDDISLQTVRYQRLMAAIKLNAMADLIALKRQARTQGFDDMLLINQQGHISEASTANIVFIRQGELVTPQPAQDYCLPGITRLRVLAAARKQGMVCHEQSIAPDDILAMDGAFLTNAAQGMITVQRIDHHRFPWPDAALALQTMLRADLEAV